MLICFNIPLQDLTRFKISGKLGTSAASDARDGVTGVRGDRALGIGKGTRNNTNNDKKNLKRTTTIRRN